MDVPSYSNANTTVSASTFYTATFIYIYVDRSLKKSSFNTQYCSYTLSSYNTIKKYTIKATAEAPGYLQDQKTTRFRFVLPTGELGEWYSNSSDYARSPNSNLVYDMTEEIFDQFYGSVASESQFIHALVNFSWYLNDQYVGDEDALTALEVAELLDEVNFGAGDSLSRTINCADMASFLSGAALSVGIPSRMVSLTDIYDDNAQHMFAEIYNGSDWYLIDPGLDAGYIFTSENNTETVSDHYTNSNGEVERLWFIWGMNSTQWGSLVDASNVATS